MIALLLTSVLLAPPDALSEEAMQLAMARRYDEAAALWQKALKTAPQHFPSLFNYGFMEFSRKRFAEAEPLLRRASQAQPKDFNTRFLLGNTLLQLNRRDDALNQWRDALKINPANMRLLQVMAVEYANGHYYLEACGAAQQALKLKSDSLETYLIAIKSCTDAQSSEAMALAETAAKQFPESARANFEYGFQLQRNGRREEAMPFLQKAMQLDATYEEPLFFYGDLLLLEDRPEEAAKHLRAALRIRSDYMAACVSLAKALMAMDRNSEAVNELKRCAESQPQHPQPHLLLSQVYYRLGDEEQARAEKDLSMRLRRQNPGLMEAPQARSFPAAPERRP